MPRSARRAESSSYWWWPGETSPATRPLLFFPPSGADQTFARPLTLPLRDLRFGVLRLPGRASRSGEPHPIGIAALAAEIAGTIAALAGPPPVLVGHSFGGMLGYRVVAALEAAGVEPALFLPVASTAPAAWREERRRESARHPDEDLDAFVERRSQRILRSAESEARTAGQDLDPQVALRMAERVRVDVRLARDGFPDAAVRTPITAIRAASDEMLSAADLAGWAAGTTGAHREVVVPGGHFFYRSRPDLLANHLRMELQFLEWELADSVGVGGPR